LLLHPAIAESGFGALGASTSCPAAAQDLPAPAVMCPDLLLRFGEVSDGRGDQGRVHPVAVVLALCAAAVVAGMRSFTAIASWATDVPAELLAQLYGRRAEAPSKATIWRVVTGADAAAVDAVIGAWLAGQAAARVARADWIRCPVAAICRTASATVVRESAGLGSPLPRPEIVHVASPESTAPDGVAPRWSKRHHWHRRRDE
jgi:hypothetical protein